VPAETLISLFTISNENFERNYKSTPHNVYPEKEADDLTFLVRKWKRGMK
jgi:hypothetical protein